MRGKGEKGEMKEGEVDEGKGEISMAHTSLKCTVTTVDMRSEGEGGPILSSEMLWALHVN